METETIYIQAEEISDSQLAEGLADGRLEFWRVDAGGTEWFKGRAKVFPSTLHGVPERPEVGGDA